MTIRDTIIERLMAACDWGLDDGRAAWGRALALATREADRYPSDELVAAKDELRKDARGHLESWYDSMFDAASAEAEADPLLFKDQPEGLWRDLVFMNEGVFAQGPDPLDGFLITVPSLRGGDVPLLLSPQLDGWGVPG